MVQRTKRRATVAAPLALLSALEPGRREICRACATVHPTGDTYRALSAVLDAMDALATHLGHEGRFSLPAHGGRS